MKANINIPHCRGIPTTKLPNWAVRERFRKDYTNREEGKGEGKRKKEKGKKKREERKEWTRRKNGRLTEQRLAASSTFFFQGESSAKRGKGTKKELPRVGKQAPSTAAVYPRIYSTICIHRVLHVHDGNESTVYYLRGVQWKPMNDIIAVASYLCHISSRYRHLLKTGHRWPLLLLLHLIGLDDVPFSSTTLPFRFEERWCEILWSGKAI